MTSTVHPSPPELSDSSVNNQQCFVSNNLETPTRETAVQGTQSSAQHPQTSENVSLDPVVAQRANTPRQDPIRQTHLINRIIYFSLLVALCSPIANFFLTYEANVNMGITFNLMMWILFGILWCLAFSVWLGPIFLIVSIFIRLLDIIPALGSSLWTLLSILLTTAVINANTAQGFLNNLPLFNLMYVNGVATLSSLYSDPQHTNITGPASSNSSQSLHDTLAIEVAYIFRHGQCGFHILRRARARHFFNLPLLSMPETFHQAYQQVRQNAMKYLRGQDLAKFNADFELWRSEARRLRRSLWIRRLFCSVGYAIETAALYFSVVVLNQLKGYTGKEDKESTLDQLSLLLPKWQMVLVALISLFSNYLWMILNIEYTFTSPSEDSSFMLQRLESYINWAGPRSGYLNNGRKLRSPWRWRGYDSVKATELPTIGIVLGDNERDTGLTVLCSTVGGCRLKVRRIGPETIRVQPLPEGEPERVGLEGGNVVITEVDTVI